MQNVTLLEKSKRIQIYLSEFVILAVCFQLKQLKKQPEINSGLNGILLRNLNLGGVYVGCVCHSFINADCSIFSVCSCLTLRAIHILIYWDAPKRGLQL